MKRASMKISSAKRLKISEATKHAYRNRDRELDSDADSPEKPPEHWNNATIGKYYRRLTPKP